MSVYITYEMKHSDHQFNIIPRDLIYIRNKGNGRVSLGVNESVNPFAAAE